MKIYSDPIELNPIIKEVGMGCNLRCQYCFYSKQPRRGELINLKIIEKIISESCKYNTKEAKFFWHGGEPLLAEIDFYKMAVDLQRKYKKPRQRIINGLQTNGTLISEDWAIFFKKEKFEIGVSLDGPQKYHDYYRQYSNGKGSFNKVMDGIEILREKKIEPSIISVVTPSIVKKPKEIFDFFVSQRFTNRINFVPAKPMPTGNNGDLCFEFSISPSTYIDFLIKIFKFWLNEGSSELKILPLESIVRAFLGLVQEDCRFAGECEKSLVIEYDGGVFGCSTYGYGDFFKFGNIGQGIKPLIHSKKFQEYREYLEQIKRNCLKCQWFEVCHGGCPHDYYLGKGENIFCKDFQRLFNYIQETLKKYELLK